MKQQIKNIVSVLLLVLLAGHAFSQLSPGDLSKAHAHLEGMRNCTKCHILGEKETTSKCLACHTEIKQLTDKNRGYHASSEVKGKKCAECHGEHFGRNFEIVKFDENDFNHQLSGYELQGKHATINCSDCHKTGFVKNKISQKKGATFLGLETKCLSCHDDNHRGTLSENCLSCHGQNSFVPAKGFEHSNTRFELTGAHSTVKCVGCHKKETRNGVVFQEFAGVAFANCTNCHTDIHKNKFGTDCTNCHTNVSFRRVKNLNSFDHEKTGYPLRGKHVSVDCKQCHKGSYTQPVKHGLCTDCHADFHEKQFMENGVATNCAECHSVETFTPSLYTIEKHNSSKFQLDGSHLATPCFACHKPEGKWNFANLGTHCVDCHENIHENYLDEKYMPDANCAQCHSNSVWTEITFDHNSTEFKLQGKHKNAGCRDCHFKENEAGTAIQEFKMKDEGCVNCHADIHYNQFKLGDENNCKRCHTFTNWEPEKFNHNNARFKLDGEHAGLDCIKCHKPTDDLIENYTVYKFEDISCASCH